MKTVKVLSRCHESTVEWEPEQFSPLGMKAAHSLYCVGDAQPKASHVKAPREVSRWIKNGCFVPMTWKRGEAAKLNAWRKEMGYSAENSGYQSRVHHSGYNR